MQPSLQAPASAIVALALPSSPFVFRPDGGPPCHVGLRYVCFAP